MVQGGVHITSDSPMSGGLIVLNVESDDILTITPLGVRRAPLTNCGVRRHKLNNNKIWSAIKADQKI